MSIAVGPLLLVASPQLGQLQQDGYRVILRRSSPTIFNNQRTTDTFNNSIVVSIPEV